MMILKYGIIFHCIYFNVFNNIYKIILLVLFMYNIYKKAISPVVSVSLLIVVVVISLVSYQVWFSNYSSKLYSDVEISSNLGNKVYIENVIGNFIYLKNGGNDNVIVNKLMLNNFNCRYDLELEPGITSLDIKLCLDNIISEKV